jgi:peptidoglycan/xylan/chitin deacetylase (PgdA/CDA1 family)
MTLTRLILHVGGAFLALGLSRAAAEPPSAPEAVSSTERPLLARCWAPEALAGTDKEVKSTRSRGGLDLEALKQESLPEPLTVPADLRGSIRSVALPPGQKLIALTFDLCESDGDHAGYDGRIVDLLRAEGVKATFFAGGKWLESHSERAQQLIADPNFEIGAHGLRHRDLSHADDKTMDEEIKLTEAAYARARGALATRSCASGTLEIPTAPQERITLMRFPYGKCNAKALAAVADAGQLAIQWDVVTGDPDSHVSAKTIANTILTRAHPGAIVVAHANGRGRNTAAALAIAVPKLKEEGYSFVTVSELLAAGKPLIAETCYLNRPGDAPRIARAKRRKKANDVFSILRSR